MLVAAARRLLAALLVAAVVLAAWPGATARAAERTVALPGHVPTRAVASAQDVGALDAATPLHLTLALEPQHPDALRALLLALATPGDPSRGHYLTTPQFAAQFGADDAQLAAVTNFLRTQGLTVGTTAPNRLLVQASGSAGQVERAFGVQLHRYRGRAGSFYAPLQDPQAPASLAAIVRAVHGLDDVPHAHPLLQRSARSAAASPVGLTPAAIRAAYDLTPAYTAGIDGAGQTLGLFELDGYAAADVAAYEQQFGLPAAPVQKVLVDGASGQAGSNAAEVAMDIELQLALAPAASQVLVYEGPNTDAGVIDTYARIADDNRAAAISTGWGQCETDSLPSTMETEAVLFEQMAAQGQSLFAASGDNGSDGCASGNFTVDDPAADPWVTGVGGTHLTLASGGGYGSETVWYSACANGPCGSGGGISGFWTQPTWQTGLGTNAEGYYDREVPDVALDADPATGYAVYVNGAWAEDGGTSAAAALWAAWAALVDQHAIGQGQPRLGFAAPTLYRVLASTQQYAAAFHDVTQGSNGRYTATPGYDDTTGLGSFDGWNLLQAVATLPTTAPVVTDVQPSSGPSAGGAAVAIAGFNLSGATAVRFGGVPATSFTVTSATSIAAITPPEAAGVVDVTVTTPLGASANSGLDRYDFVAPVPAGQATAYQIDAAHDGAAQFGALPSPLPRRWTANLGGPASYPLIAQGKVFATTEPAGAGGAELVALDEGTGRTVWGPIALGPGSFAAPTFDGGRIFVQNDNGLLQAFDAGTGALLWTRILTGQIYFQSPPTAHGGIVYTSGSESAGTLYAVDGATGAVLWTAFVQNGEYSSPAVTADGVYVSYSCNQAYKFDPVNGTLIWNYNGGCEGGGGATPVYANGRLYVRDIGFGDLILDTDNGTVVGSFSAGPPPVLTANAIISLNGQTLQAVDPISHAILWTFGADGTLGTAPILVNQTVLEGSTSGALYALDAASGALLWSANTGAAIPADGRQYPPTGLAAGDGLVVTPSGNALIAYAAAAIDPIGGRDFTLDTQAGGPVALAWNSGTTQTGYVVARMAPNGTALLPAGGPLPAAASGYTDSSRLTDAYDCYAAVPLNGTSALGVSDVLCDRPQTRSGPAPVNFNLQLDQSNTASLSWTFPGQLGPYQLLAVRADGTQRTITPAGNSLSASDDTGGVATCYVLAATTAATTPWNTDVLCAIPGVTTLAGGATQPAGTLDRALDRARQAVSALQHARPGSAARGEATKQRPA